MKNLNLLEVIFSLLIISVFMIPIFSQFPLSLEEVILARKRHRGLELLHEKLETIRTEYALQGFDFVQNKDYSDQVSDLGNFTRTITKTASGADELILQLALGDVSGGIGTFTLVYHLFRDLSSGTTPLAEGDYLSFGGNNWILLDKNTRMVISKNSVVSRVFHGTKLQSWDVLGTPQANICDLNTWLNGAYLNSIDPLDQFIERNSTFSIEAGNGSGSSVTYTWNGAVGLLSLTQFNALNTGGPNLNGSTQKAIEPYNGDQNMSDKWWLLTPSVSNEDKVEEVNGGGSGSSNADSTNEVRPLLYLKAGLKTLSGDGSEGSPWNVTP